MTIFHIKSIRIFSSLSLRPSLWDGAALLVVTTLITLVVWGSRDMTIPYTLDHMPPLSLDPMNLPYYALRTVLRMFFALLIALVFSFIYASIAAKYKKAELILIPVLDILQSVPILGFLSITVIGFMRLFPGNLLGLECASIFAIFTSQAWNMTFSLYQSFISVPKELTEVARVYHLSSWQRYWRLDVPYAVPLLLWNTMMSVSGGWFFVVASEAITISGHSIMLPGVGSYIALAAREESTQAIFYAILTMGIVIFLYDQLLFRPLLAWSNKFKAELTAHNDIPSSWVLTIIRRSAWVGMVNTLGVSFLDFIRNLKRPHKFFYIKNNINNKAIIKLLGHIILPVLLFFFIGLLLYYGIKAYGYFIEKIDFEEIQYVIFLGFLTLMRVAILCALASLIWVPIGVMIGLDPRLTHRFQPWVQFMAAFPANLFFPVIVSLIVAYQLNPDIWLSPLIILGTQWYILFNVIGGAASIPFDFQELSHNFHVRGWLQWKKLYLPGIAPSYVTGLITAVGGSWNASIVAEYVSWGDKTLEAKGLGSYIAAATAASDQPRILLGVLILSLYVVIINRILWHPLYVFATTRYRLD